MFFNQELPAYSIPNTFYTIFYNEAHVMCKLPLRLWNKNSTSSEDAILVFFAVVHCGAAVVSSADVPAGFRRPYMVMIGHMRTLIIVPNLIIQSFRKIYIFIELSIKFFRLAVFCFLILCILLMISCR